MSLLAPCLNFDCASRKKSLNADLKTVPFDSSTAYGRSRCDYRGVAYLKQQMDFQHVNNKPRAGEDPFEKASNNLIAIPNFDTVLQWEVFLQLWIWALLISAVSLSSLFLNLFFVRSFFFLSKENWQNTTSPSPFSHVSYLLAPKFCFLPCQRHRNSPFSRRHPLLWLWQMQSCPSLIHPGICCKMNYFSSTSFCNFVMSPLFRFSVVSPFSVRSHRSDLPSPSRHFWVLPAQSSLIYCLLFLTF